MRMAKRAIFNVGPQVAASVALCLLLFLGPCFTCGTKNAFGEEESTHDVQETRLTYEPITWMEVLARQAKRLGCPYFAQETRTVLRNKLTSAGTRHKPDMPIIGQHIAVETVVNAMTGEHLSLHTLTHPPTLLTHTHSLTPTHQYKFSLALLICPCVVHHP